MNLVKMRNLVYIENVNIGTLFLGNNRIFSTSVKEDSVTNRSPAVNEEDSDKTL